MQFDSSLIHVEHKRGAI